MKRIIKYTLLTAAVIGLGFVVFGFIKSLGVFAATTPSLGAAATYGILANTYTNSAAGTTINGDVGFTVGPTVEPDPVGGHTNYGSGAPYTTAGTDQSSAASALNAQGCTTTFPGAVDLFLDTTHGTAGVYTPGVYCATGAITITGSLTFNGAGTYTFRSVGALDTTAGITINLTGGASACDVFWTPSGDTTLGAGTNFKGTVIDNGAITIGANTVWAGRALAFNGAITSGANSSITVPTCTPPPATLHVVKQVVNNSGGSAAASSFNLHVKSSGTDVSGSPAAGATSPGTSYSLAAGTYVVSEDANSAYAQSFSGDCNSGGSITLASGEDKTCTITNNDIAPTLHVIKHVVNSRGGTATASSFNLHVKLSGTDVAGSPAVGVESPGNSYMLNNGTYTVSEDANAGYTQVFSGDCDSSGSVSLSLGDDKTCTITNTDMLATITVAKVVVNDSGRTKNITDFPLFVNGSSVASGITNSFAPGTYAITETTDPNYTQTFSGDCDSSGNVSISLGDTKVCTITNDDIGAPVIIPPVPPLISLVKVPGPLTLPSGPGSTTYTYALHNIGTVTATNVTMADDSCSPLAYVSGDANANAQLEVNETWTYTCQASLTATHTNNAVATGLANSITATDTASATTVVGSSAVPPLIHVTNIPNVVALITGGGLVTFTQSVTNPGTAPLSNVVVTNDTFPLSYVSGDTNNDSKLDSTETWIYTGQINLTKTTTTTTTVTGEANSLQARDFAFATVVVATAFPRFPNTGLGTAPQTGEGVLILVGSAVVILPFFYLVRKWAAAWD